MNNAASLARDLGSLLQREYVALLDGDLTAFEHLISERAVLLEAISVMKSPELKSFAPYRDQIARNQRLARSAIKGMRAAICRAKDIQTVSSGLRTYQKDGQGRLVSMKSGDGLSKRS